MNPGIFNIVTDSTQVSGGVKTPLQWTSGATGAVPALSAFAFRKGVTSVTRTGTGVFVIVFDNAAVNLINFSNTIIQASYSKNGACKAVITANAVTTPATHQLTITVVDGDGDAVDPTTGDVIVLVFDLQWYNA